ncbi:MAG: class I SAM-dependent methyltransferase [Legionellales bacterium]|nr:class I SAM-dependent methyltransferase [Legionellales bacterium]
MVPNAIRIAVLANSEQMKQLAFTLALPAVAFPDPDYEFLLLERDYKLSLCWQLKKPVMYLTVDFVQGSLAYRQKQALQQEAVAKAVGIKSQYRPYVVDATAGLGRDAFILASLGCQVTLIEQHPIVAALLRDGLLRLLQNQALSMELIQANAISMLDTLEQKPDVVYLDPLFPPRTKSALVKKDMQILQRLTHGDMTDNQLLFQAALRCATKRVVVKRPGYAPVLDDAAPVDFIIETPHHRFDIYKVNTA